MGFRGAPYILQYAAATCAAVTLAFPFVCAMFILLSFGMGLAAGLAVAGIVFLWPPALFAWWFVGRRSEEASRKRAAAWRVWTLSLILHLGFSAGFCRVWAYLPNAPRVEQGAFVEDYLKVVFMPVLTAWELTRPAPRHA